MSDNQHSIEWLNRKDCRELTMFRIYREREAEQKAALKAKQKAEAKHWFDKCQETASALQDLLDLHRDTCWEKQDQTKLIQKLYEEIQKRETKIQELQKIISGLTDDTGR